MKKSYIIVFSGLFIYFILIIILFWNDIGKKNIKEYMYIGYDDKFVLDNDKLKFGSNTLNEKYFVYEDNIYKGQYNIKYFRNNIYLFDDNWDSIKLNGDFIAVSNKEIIKVKDFKIEKLNNPNDKYLTEILKENRIKFNNIDELNVNQKITLDFDNDNEEETLYLISNMFSEKRQSNKSYSFVYYVDNGRIQTIKSEVVDNNNSLDSSIYLISAILDYNNDNKNEIIISKNKFSIPKDCKMIYKFEKNKYILEDEC